MSNLELETEIGHLRRELENMRQWRNNCGDEIGRLQTENATLKQEVEITRKLNEALRSRKHDQKALQAAILERCNVALDIVELQQAMQDARVSA